MSVTMHIIYALCTDVNPPPDNSATYTAPLTATELHRAIEQLNTSGKATGQDQCNLIWDDPATPWQSSHTAARILPRLLDGWKYTFNLETSASHRYTQAGQTQPLCIQSSTNCPHTTSWQTLRETCDGQVDSLSGRKNNNILPRQHAGSERVAAVLSIIVKLNEHAIKNITQNKTTMATFFDIKKAFDTVWHARLLHTLG